MIQRICIFPTKNVNDAEFHVFFFLQPLAVLVCASVGILWACYPLLTIQVYSGDAKV